MMTAMMPALELFIDTNILLLLAYGFWWVAQTALQRSGLRHNFPLQLRILKTTLVLTMLSPLMALAAVTASQALWPQTPITIGDIAVAAYLRGDIAIPAVEFEALLNTRSRTLEALFDSHGAWLIGLALAAAAGAAAQAAMTLRSAIKLRRAIAHSYLWRQTRTTEIRVSDTVTVPFAARGLTRRYVVLPSSLVTHPRDLRLILAHEFQHLRGGDVEWELAFEAMRPLLYWNPAFLMWKRAFNRLRDLACDQSVVTRRRITAGAYADCLVDFCERRIRTQAPRAMRVAFLQTGSRNARRMFEDRILALEHIPTGARKRAAAVMLTVLLAFGISLAAASVRQSGDWSQDRLMLSTVVNLERLEARGF